MKTILEEIKIVQVPPNDGATTTYDLAAGVTDPASVAVDALGYGRVCFLAEFGDNADTGVFTMAIEGSADGSTGWTAITGATTTFTAGAADTDSEMLAVECGTIPAYRYYRVQITRATANTVLRGLQCLLGRKEGRVPVTQLTSTGQFIQTPVLVA